MTSLSANCPPKLAESRTVKHKAQSTTKALEPQLALHRSKWNQSSANSWTSTGWTCRRPSACSYCLSAKLHIVLLPSRALRIVAWVSESDIPEWARLQSLMRRQNCNWYFLVLLVLFSTFWYFWGTFWYFGSWKLRIVARVRVTFQSRPDSNPSWGDRTPIGTSWYFWYFLVLSVL